MKIRILHQIDDETRLAIGICFAGRRKKPASRQELVEFVSIAVERACAEMRTRLAYRRTHPDPNQQQFPFLADALIEAVDVEEPQVDSAEIPAEAMA